MGRRGDLRSQLDKVVFLVIREEFVTASFIQRKLGITYTSAQEVLRELSKIGYIEEYKPYKKLKVVKQHFIS